ncbi:MAG: transposase [Bacteroidetes bacterium]|nr:transposase [Bacteroidota bacterium]
MSNRWIQLGFHLPWDTLVKIYQSKFSKKHGSPATNPRWIIGSLIIKHILNLSDEETLQIISENPYMQFFLDCKPFARTCCSLQLSL